MKIRSLILVIGTVIFGYMVYLYIQTSATLPSLVKHRFVTSRGVFENELLARINSRGKWSFEKSDSVDGDHGERCFWASVVCHEVGQQQKFEIKYCVNQSSKNEQQCLDVYVIGAFDREKKIGGYKISDDGVKTLVNFFDKEILNGLAPNCSD